MHIAWRIISIFLSLITLVAARPQSHDHQRRADGSAARNLAADNAEAVDDAAMESATDALLENMFGDQSFWTPPGNLTIRKAELHLRTERIKQAFLHSWNNYREKGLPQDEVRPVTGAPYSTRNGWGASAIDALGTAIIMGLKKPVNDIVGHIKTVNFAKSNTDQPVSLFETTIRYLGGLLSGYDLLREPERVGMVDGNDVNMLLRQATNLADALSVAFKTPSGVPYNEINPDLTGPASGKDFNIEKETANLAQAGSLILEWSRLASATGNNTYRELVQRAQWHLMNPHTWGPMEMPADKRDIVEPWPGLVGFDIFLKNGTFKNGWGSWSGGADSYYEYLIKMWIYNSSPSNRAYRDRWIMAVNSSRLNLRSHPVPPKHSSWFPKPPTILSPSSPQQTGSRFTPPEVAFMQGWRADQTRSNFSQHLTCFDGGNILLGAQVIDENALRNVSGLSKDLLAGLGLRRSAVWPDFVRFALELIEGCHHLYTSTLTQIGPEVFSWWWNEKRNHEPPFYKIEKSPVYILRPEVMESYYYAYRITGQSKYQDWAWEAFLAIDKYCRSHWGYSTIRDVNATGIDAADFFGEERYTAKKIREDNLADEQESFWFAETLKYAYLIQQDGDEPWHVARGLRLRTEKNRYVYNTEAHPLRIEGPPI